MNLECLQSSLSVKGVVYLIHDTGGGVLNNWLDVEGDATFDWKSPAFDPS
jgi:hypothetical protein